MLKSVKLYSVFIYTILFASVFFLLLNTVHAESMVEDTDCGDVSVELKSVTKSSSGDTITAKFKYSNNGTAQNISKCIGKDHDNLIVHFYYVDPLNNKKYFIVKDTEGAPLGTNLKYFELKEGESKSGWVKFPAPGAGVDKISVYLVGAPPFEDVEIIQK